MVMQLLLPALILMFWSESISADCYPATYPYKSQCEEALASDAQNYTECSTLNFTTELLICELRSPADLEALKSGRLVIPGSPAMNGDLDCLLTDCSTIVVCAPLASFTVYICFKKTATALVLDEHKDEMFGEMWFYQYKYRVSSNKCPFVAKSTLLCADQFVQVKSAVEYPNTNQCPQVGRKSPPVTPLACRQYACKEYPNANVVCTMPDAGWCQYRACSNTHDIPYVPEPAGHTWVMYAKHP